LNLFEYDAFAKTRERAVFSTEAQFNKQIQTATVGEKGTTIYVHSLTKQRLKKSKGSGEDYEDVIQRLLQIHERVYKEKPVEELSSAGKYWNKIQDFQLESAGKTWKIVDYINTHGVFYRKCQLCGHFPCRHLYIIQNPVTGEKKIIGGICVVNCAKNEDAEKILTKHRDACMHADGFDS
jgi:hypothetical protein